MITEGEVLCLWLIQFYCKIGGEERVHLARLAWLLSRATLLPVPILLGPLARRAPLGTRDLSVPLSQGTVL